MYDLGKGRESHFFGLTVPLTVSHCPIVVHQSVPDSAEVLLWTNKVFGLWRHQSVGGVRGHFSMAETLVLSSLLNQTKTKLKTEGFIDSQYSTPCKLRRSYSGKSSNNNIFSNLRALHLSTYMHEAQSSIIYTLCTCVELKTTT